MVATVKGFGPRTVNVSKAPVTDRVLAVVSIIRRQAALCSGDQLSRTLGQVTWVIDRGSPQTEAYRDTRGPGLKGKRGRLAIAKLRTITPRVGAIWC